MNSSADRLRTAIYSFRGRIILATIVVAMGVTALYFGIEEMSLYRILVASAVLIFGIIGIGDAFRNKGKEQGNDAPRD